MEIIRDSVSKKLIFEQEAQWMKVKSKSRSEVSRQSKEWVQRPWIGVCLSAEQGTQKEVFGAGA